MSIALDKVSQVNISSLNKKTVKANAIFSNPVRTIGTSIAGGGLLIGLFSLFKDSNLGKFLGGSLLFGGIVTAAIGLLSKQGLEQKVENQDLQNNSLLMPLQSKTLEELLKLNTDEIKLDKSTQVVVDIAESIVDPTEELLGVPLEQIKWKSGHELPLDKLVIFKPDPTSPYPSISEFAIELDTCPYFTDSGSGDDTVFDDIERAVSTYHFEPSEEYGGYCDIGEDEEPIQVRYEGEEVQQLNYAQFLSNVKALKQQMELEPDDFEVILPSSGTLQNDDQAGVYETNLNLAAVLCDGDSHTS